MIKPIGISVDNQMRVGNTYNIYKASVKNKNIVVNKCYDTSKREFRGLKGRHTTLFEWILESYCMLCQRQLVVHRVSAPPRLLDRKEA